MIKLRTRLACNCNTFKISLHNHDSKESQGASQELESVSYLLNYNINIDDPNVNVCLIDTLHLHIMMSLPSLVMRRACLTIDGLLPTSLAEFASFVPISTLGGFANYLHIIVSGL
jgi:hypothetical protein